MKKHTMKRLGGYLLQYKWFLFLAFALTVTSNLFALAGPKLSGQAVDAIAPGMGRVDFGTVMYYLIWMGVFYAASSIFSYLLAFLMIQISRRVVGKMRNDVFDKLMELPVGYFDIHQTGDIISRISYDIDTINTSLSNDVVQVLASIITVIGAFFMMVVTSPVLVTVFLVTIPLSMALTGKLTGITRPLFRRRSQKLGELNGFVEEMVSGQKTLKAYVREPQIIEEFAGINKEAADAYYKSEYYSSSVGPSINFMNNLSMALISVFGALLYLHGSMSIGNISTFILYSRKFSSPINEVANIISELQSALAAAERVFMLMDEAAEPGDLETAADIGEPEGRVELSDITFGYDKAQPIIKGLNLTALPGKRIAVVGPTGAGKTTLINLLMRFYDADKGKIFVDGKELAHLTRKSLRGSYAMVLQDTWLFYGTIYENIAYGKENASRQEVEAAAKAAKIHSFIQRLPKGYDTILSDDGTNISKGQKQLLTIARAMLLDAHMLILDEATSNVDTRTEIQIQQAMTSLMKNKTCFIIAHRLSTIRNADIILVVEKGEIVEQGTHEELMEINGYYRELYCAQFQ